MVAMIRSMVAVIEVQFGIVLSPVSCHLFCAVYLHESSRTTKKPATILFSLGKGSSNTIVMLVTFQKGFFLIINKDSKCSCKSAAFQNPKSKIVLIIFSHGVVVVHYCTITNTEEE